MLMVLLWPVMLILIKVQSSFLTEKTFLYGELHQNDAQSHEMTDESIHGVVITHCACVLLP